VCTERRAVVMIFKGVARVEEHNGHVLHSQRLAIHAPSVIRLTEYIHILRTPLALAQEHPLARPLDLPVLWEAISAFGTDSRSRAAALAWRGVRVG
jgi:hypothetical protein